MSQRGLESCDGGFRWSADTRLKTRSLSRLTESQVLSLLEASQSVPKILVAGSHGMFQFAKGKDQRIEALGPVRELTVEGGHHCHMDDGVAATIYSAWQEFLIEA